MLESYYDTKVEKPCNDCNILQQVGGLEYANGTNANIDSGLWYVHLDILHHLSLRIAS
jgi:hypothetical protein